MLWQMVMQITTYKRSFININKSNKWVLSLFRIPVWSHKNCSWPVIPEVRLTNLPLSPPHPAKARTKSSYCNSLFSKFVFVGYKGHSNILLITFPRLIFGWFHKKMGAAYQNQFTLSAVPALFSNQPSNFPLLLNFGKPFYC